MSSIVTGSGIAVVRDDFKATSRLTLTLGLRFEPAHVTVTVENPLSAESGPLPAGPARRRP